MVDDSTSKLAELLKAGKFVVTAEVGPPKHAFPDDLIQMGELLKDYCDAINLTDNQSAVVRMSSLASCLHISQAGAEPVFQLTVRDRNRLALQSDLLGAYSLGIRNILCLSGDHPSLGNHPQGCFVGDLDSIHFIRVVRDMIEEKKFSCGEDIKHPPWFFIGASENPFADPLELRVLRLEKKIAAGVKFIQTQSIFDVERFEKWMEMVREAGLHKKAYILAGLTPLKSARAAWFVGNKVAGMLVPQAVIDRLKEAEDPKKEGIEICLEHISRICSIPGVAGIHLMAVGWEDIVPAIVERSGLFPRPSL